MKGILLFSVLFATMAAGAKAPNCPPPSCNPGPWRSTQTRVSHTEYHPAWRDPLYYGLPERGPITQPRYAAPAPIVIGKPVATAPVSLQQPVVIPQPVAAKPEPKNATVWVEGRYVDQKKPDGTVIRTWQPGHYEQRPLP